MKVLAVDDEKNAREILVRAIEEAEPQAKISACATASAALAMIKEEHLRPVIAFLDIELPGMGGIELAKEIKILCPETWIVFVTGFSQYALDAFAIHARGYIMKPVTADRIREELDEPCLRPISELGQNHVKVQTFGNFEVYVNGESLRFSRSKAKEMFAYLVNKKGSSCTTRELFAVLFEDKPYEKQQADYLQKISQSMIKAFADSGNPGVIRKSYNSISVDVTKFDCDRYRFDELDPNAINAYNGEYMNQYEWAEYSVGYMDQMLSE